MLARCLNALFVILCTVSQTLLAEPPSQKDIVKEAVVSVFESEPEYRVVKEVDYLQVKLEVISNMKSINKEALEKKLDIEYARKMNFVIPRAPTEQEEFDFKRVGQLTCRLISASDADSYFKPVYFTCYIEATLADENSEGGYCFKEGRALEIYNLGIVSDNNAMSEMNKSIEQAMELMSSEAYSIRSGSAKEKFKKEVDGFMKAK